MWILDPPEIYLGVKSELYLCLRGSPRSFQMAAVLIEGAGELTA